VSVVSLSCVILPPQDDGSDYDEAGPEGDVDYAEYVLRLFKATHRLPFTGEHSFL
jgi:hypothetical protein